MVDIPDVVTYTNFGDHRLRGFGVAGGQISPSPIDFHHRPYNTLALPCECVIMAYKTLLICKITTKLYCGSRCHGDLFCNRTVFLHLAKIYLNGF